MTSLIANKNTVVYKGKVRDVYTDGDFISIVTSDRISAFDHILPETIPYKGAVLNGISTFFLNRTKDIVPNWLIETPDSYLSYGHNAPTIPIEVIVRNYLTGSMLREYQSGVREYFGIQLPDGMKPHQKLEKPIITPTIKATSGHDESITEQEIIKQAIVSREDWAYIVSSAFKIYEFGQKYAASKGLILVDTKFEFGRRNDGVIILIDEILTPDSSRYFIAESYQDSISNNTEPVQLSKEFVRQWLIKEGFMGREGDKMPEMNNDKIHEISERYIGLYNKLLPNNFVKEENEFDLNKIQNIYDHLTKN